MLQRKDSQRTKVRYAGSVDVIDSSVDGANRPFEPNVSIQPLKIAPHHGSNPDLTIGQRPHKLIPGNSFSNSIKKRRSKTVRKYKISFSYACSTDQDTSQVSPKIINLQRLDQVTTKSDHRFVSDKLKPVMTCIVQRLIQEYRRSNERILLNDGNEGKSTSNDSYTLSTSISKNSKMEKVKASLERCIKEEDATSARLLNSYSPKIPHRNLKVLGPPEDSTTHTKIKMKQMTPLYSRSFMKCNSSSRSGSSGITKRSHSKDNFVLPNLVKDTYLFKRTKMVDSLITNFGDSIEKATILNWTVDFDNSSDIVDVGGGVEACSFTNECHSEDYWDDVSQITSFRRNIHIPEYHLVEECIFSEVLPGILQLIFMAENLHNCSYPREKEARNSNFSNQKNGEISDKSTMSKQLKSYSEDQISVMASGLKKKIAMSHNDPTVTSCALVREVKKKKIITEALNEDEEDHSLSSNDSEASSCKICHGDPVICLESEGRKSVLRSYVNLIEEADGEEVKKTETNEIDMEDLKRRLYRYMEENNLYPSEKVKTGIMAKRGSYMINKDLEDSDMKEVSRRDFKERLSHRAWRRADDLSGMKVGKELMSNDLEVVDGIDPLQQQEKAWPMTSVAERSLLSGAENNLIEGGSLSVSKGFGGTKKKKSGKEPSFNNATGTVPTSQYLTEQVVSTKADRSVNKNLSGLDDLETLNLHQKTQLGDSSILQSLNKNAITRVKSFDDIVKEGKGFENYLNDKEGRDNNQTDEDELTNSSKIFNQPITRKSTIYRQSIFHPEVSAGKYEKPIDAKKGDKLPVEDIFIEIDDNQQRRPRRFSIVDVGNQTTLPPILMEPTTSKNQKAKNGDYDRNKPLSPVNSTSSMIKISTYDNPIKESVDKSVSSYESDHSQDTSGDLVSKYPNEISNYMDIFNNISIENEENLLNSLKRSRPKHKDGDETLGRKMGSDGLGRSSQRVKNISSTSIDDGGRHLPVEALETSERYKRLGTDVDPNKGSYRDGGNIPERAPPPRSSSLNKSFKSSTLIRGNDGKMLSGANFYEEMDPNFLNDRRSKTESKLYETGTQTDGRNLGMSSRNIQTDFATDRKDRTLGTERLNDKDLLEENGGAPGNRLTKQSLLNDLDSVLGDSGLVGDREVPSGGKTAEIERILSKLRAILSKSEEFLHNFSSMSQNLPDSNRFHPDMINIPKDLFLLLKDLCRKEDAGPLSKEERYKVLDRNLEILCKSLNLLGVKDGANYPGNDPNYVYDDGRGRPYSPMNPVASMVDNDYMYENQPDERVNGKGLDGPSNDPLFERVVRCVMYKLIENQQRCYSSQRISPRVRGREADYYQTGPNNMTRSLDNVSLIDRPLVGHLDCEGFGEESRYQLGTKSKNGFFTPRSKSPNFDSLLADCLPADSTELITRVRSNNDKIKCFNVYDEIANRMNCLLDQVKKSQQECNRAVPPLARKVTLSSKQDLGRLVASNQRHLNLPRSYSTSDLGLKGICPPRDVSRHTVASIQNIISTANQSRKIRTGVRNIRKELKDKANRLILNSKHRQKMLCSSVKEENICNSANKTKVLIKTFNKRKVIR